MLETGSDFDQKVLSAIETDDQQLFEQLFPNPTTKTLLSNSSTVFRNVNQHLILQEISQPILFIAISKHANKILEYLLHEYESNSADVPPLQVNCTNSIQSNALHIAASCNNIEATMMLLTHSKFSKKNERDMYGWHAIHIAASQNFCEVLGLLITIGNIDVNLKKGQSGKTPLHFAMENQHLEMVNLLLDSYRANFNARDSENMPAVMRLACNTVTQYSTSFLESVLQRDLDFVCSVKCSLKQNILHKCAMFSNLHFLKQFIQIVPQEKLAKMVNEIDGTMDLYTPLHYACYLNLNSEIAEILITYCKANILITDARGNTACHMVASKKDNPKAFSICNMLLASPLRKELLKIKNHAQESIEALLETTQTKMKDRRKSRRASETVIV